MNEKWAKKTDTTFGETLKALAHVKKEKAKRSDVRGRGRGKVEEKVPEKVEEKEEKNKNAKEVKDDDTRSPEV